MTSSSLLFNYGGCRLYENIQHGLVREALRLTGIESGVEITTIADIPGQGTGLGSSSSVTVGLLNAMHAFQGRRFQGTARRRGLPD